MKSWPTKKLGELTDVRMGETLIKKDLTGDGTPIFSAGIDIKPWGFTKKNTLTFSKNSIVLSARGTIGEPRLPLLKKFTATQTTIVVTNKSENVLDTIFLWRFLQTFNFNTIKNQAAIPMMTVSDVNKTEILLPPLKIQKRIVARIEELFEKIDKVKELRQKAQEQTAQIFQSALQEIFSKAEKKWKTEKLGNIVELHYGKGIPRKDRKVNGKYPIYGANGELGRTDKYFVEGKAIIIGRKGTAGAVNRVSGRFWPADVTYYVFGNKKIDIDFLFYAFEKINLSQLAIGIKPGINRNKVYELKIPLPPLSEQKKIVAYLDGLREKVEKLKQLQQNQSEELTELKQSILDKAFKGKLCINNKL